MVAPALMLAFDPPVIAHRGASAEAPENTLAAFAPVRGTGANWIEFDVQLTQDGVPVLMHDDTLDRTTNGKGKVSDMNWAEMKMLDAGSWFGPAFAGERVPHLVDILQFILENDLRFNMEIKPTPGREKATAMVAMIEVAKVWPHNRPFPLISSFSEEALSIAQQLQPHWPRSFAFDRWDGGWQSAAARIEAEALSVDARLINADNMGTLRQNGRKVIAYTVNEPTQARHLLNLGVSAVFSDRPKAIIGAL